MAHTTETADSTVRGLLVQAPIRSRSPRGECGRDPPDGQIGNKAGRAASGNVGHVRREIPSDNSYRIVTPSLSLRERVDGRDSFSCCRVCTLSAPGSCRCATPCRAHPVAGNNRMLFSNRSNRSAHGHSLGNRNVIFPERFTTRPGIESSCMRCVRITVKRFVVVSPMRLVQRMRL